MSIHFSKFQIRITNNKIDNDAYVMQIHRYCQTLEDSRMERYAPAVAGSNFTGEAATISCLHPPNKLADKYHVEFMTVVAQNPCDQHSV